MCLSCGCGLPNEGHDDDRHITFADLQQAATAAGVSPKKAAKNIRKTLKSAKDGLGTAQHEFEAGPGSDPQPAPGQVSPTPVVARMNPFPGS